MQNRELRMILLDHAAKYPLSEPTDWVKLVYQHTLGGGHLIKDPVLSMERLKKELQETKQTGEELTEELGNGLVRLKLSAMEASGISCETVNRIFVLSAEKTAGTMKELEENLTTLRELTEKGVFPFEIETLDRYLRKWEEEGRPAVSHSERYREAYRPAYRVVRKEYLQFVHLLAAIDTRIREKGKAVIAIDGRCASGKTTLADRLGDIYGAAVYHMDDYFLRPEQRTPERLAEPGGNVDRERFTDEILTGIASGRSFAWRPFDCSAMELAAPVMAEPSDITVVEGSYSMHPDLRGAWDICVFMDIDPEEQVRRIRIRNGEAAAEKFQTRWIPLEEKYFDTLSIREHCDLVLHG